MQPKFADSPDLPDRCRYAASWFPDRSAAQMSRQRDGDHMPVAESVSKFEISLKVEPDTSCGFCFRW
jgi:hypothetical protein